MKSKIISILLDWLEEPIKIMVRSEMERHKQEQSNVLNEKPVHIGGLGINDTIEGTDYVSTYLKEFLKHDKK